MSVIEWNAAVGERRAPLNRDAFEQMMKAHPDV